MFSICRSIAIIAVLFTATAANAQLSQPWGGDSNLFSPPTMANAQSLAQPTLAYPPPSTAGGYGAENFAAPGQVAHTAPTTPIPQGTVGGDIQQGALSNGGIANGGVAYGTQAQGITPVAELSGGAGGCGDAAFANGGVGLSLIHI